VPEPQSPNHLQPVGGDNIRLSLHSFSIVLKRLGCKDTIFLGKDKRNISFFENLIIYTGKHQGVWGRVAPQIWLKVKKKQIILY